MSAREGYRWQSKAWSPSEMQARILDGVARGLTNSQIAAEVGISPDGVKWHVSRALSETGLDGRGDLALWWQSPKADIDFRMHALLPAGPQRRPMPAVRLDYGPSLRTMTQGAPLMSLRDQSWRILRPPVADLSLPNGGPASAADFRD